MRQSRITHQCRGGVHCVCATERTVVKACTIPSHTIRSHLILLVTHTHNRSHRRHHSLLSPPFSFIYTSIIPLSLPFPFPLLLPLLFPVLHNHFPSISPSPSISLTHLAYLGVPVRLLPSLCGMCCSVLGCLYRLERPKSTQYTFAPWSPIPITKFAWGR